jgi:hypothetical protein
MYAAEPGATYDVTNIDELMDVCIFNHMTSNSGASSQRAK